MSTGLHSPPMAARGPSPPLRHRLPNPPPQFVGRDVEIAALTAALARSPVAVLCGPGGVGKTALALQALSGMQGFEPERALFIEIRSAEPVEDPRLQIIGALARAQGLDRASWGDVLLDDDAIGGTLIDLAEWGGWWVLVDDLHHLPREDSDRLLKLLARYARRSRWVATTRTTPEIAELKPQVLSLAGLDAVALRALALAFVPELPEAEIQRAVEASGGSPWALQQLLAAPGGEGDDRLLGALPDGAREFLEALVPIDRALPLDALATFTPLPVTEVLHALVQRGLVQRGFGGYRLHDVVRRMLGAASPLGRPAASSLVAARPLASHADAEATLEGARLLILAGAIDEVSRTLERCGAQLVDQGHAPRLWQLLQLADDARLARWRLCCAVALAQPALLEKIPEPIEQSVAVRLLWARALMILGRSEAALTLARALRDEAMSLAETRLAGEAGLIEVEALAELERHAEAINVIVALPPTSNEALVAIRDSWLVLCLAEVGRWEEATLRLAPLWDRRGAHKARATRQVTLNLARAFQLMDRYSEAYTASEAVILAGMPTGKTLRSHFVTAMSAGHFAEAGQILVRMEPFSPPRSALRARYDVLVILHRLFVGRLRGIGQLISRVKQDLAACGDLTRLQVVLQYERELRMGQGEPPAPLAGEELVGPKTPWSLLYDEAWRLRAVGTPAATMLREAVATPGSHRLFLEEIELTAQLLSGDPGAAAERCASVVRAAADMGWRLFELGMHQLQCDILVILGATEQLRVAVQAYATLATACDSERYLGESRFFLAFLGPRRADWDILEKIAKSDDVSPIAARRARLLLGDAAPVDAVDRLVLSALRAHLGVQPAVSLKRSDGDATPRALAPWGIADDGRRVWLSDRASFSLSDRPQLWQILVCLFQHGGEASKEQLVCEVWALADYHPLRHDNRLQVAIRKLRKLIEVDASKPELLVTTADGYALVGTVRRARSG